MRELIRASYREAVLLAKVPQELKLALKTSERVPGFLTNLEREVLALPLKFQNAMTVKKLVYDLTDVFLRNIERKSTEKIMSDAQKTSMIRAHDKAKRIDQAVDSGIITEEVLEDV